VMRHANNDAEKRETGIMKKKDGSRWWEVEPLRIVVVGQMGLDDRNIARELDDALPMQGNMQHVHVMKMGKGCGLTDKGLFFKTPLARQNQPDGIAGNTAFARKHGVRTVIYFNVHAVAPEFGRRHPDWLQIKQDGKPLDTVYSTGVSFCINSGFRDWCFQILRDLCSYDIDGIFYDGPIFFHPTCYCETCRAKFKKLYGRKMPPKDNKRHPGFPGLLEFQTQSLVQFLKDSDRVVKSINPNILLYMNGGMRTANWPTGRMNRELIKGQDILGSEGGFLYEDLRKTPIWKPGCESKLLETQCPNKPRVIFNCVAHKPWNVQVLTSAEIWHLYADCLANGAWAWFAAFPENITSPESDPIGKINKLIVKRPEVFYNTRSVADVGLVWSNLSANYYEGSPIPETDFTGSIKASRVGDIYQEFNGFYDALLRSHTLFDVVDEVSLDNLDDLKKYRMLILPNTACMSGRSVRNLRRYVREGGSILATFETSLYDEQGRRLKDFQLKDLFGVALVGDVFNTGMWNYISPVRRHRLLKDMCHDRLPSPGFGITVKARGADTVCNFLERLVGRYDGMPEKPREPAVMLRRYGKGKALYVAGTWGDTAWQMRFPEYYRFISNAVLTFVRPRLEIGNAPDTLEVTLRRNREKGLYLLHLVNFSGDMIRPMRTIRPCRNIDIRIRNVPKVRRVGTVVSGGGRALKFRTEKGKLCFRVPRVNEYEIVAVECWR